MVVYGSMMAVDSKIRHPAATPSAELWLLGNAKARRRWRRRNIPNRQRSAAMERERAIIAGALAEP